MDPISELEIQVHLDRILASPGFRSSERLQRFLRFTVERTLAGEAAQLKEYLVGRDVFDRGSTYDPRMDSIVRVEAQRLRRKLREYYQTHGSADSIRISLQAGSYVPGFTRPVRADTAGSRNSASPRPTDPRTVAVLPFLNLSPEPAQEYFCDGIAEDIVNALAWIPQLKIIGRTTFALKRSSTELHEIGAGLGAGTFVEGTVRKVGDILRISAKLVSFQTQQVSWSCMFDRQTEDLFAIGDEVASSIANALRATLNPDYDRKAFPTHLSPEQSLLPMPHSQNIDPPSATCDACQQGPSEWFIYLISKTGLIAKTGPTVAYHSRRCELCTKELIMSLVKNSTGPILISHWKPRLEVWL